MALHKDLVGADIHETKFTLNAGTPVGSVTPSALGIAVCDTLTNKLYRSTGLTNADWVLVGDGLASTPGGATTEVQFNNAGAFAGDSAFTFDVGADTVHVGGIALSSPGTAVIIGGLSSALPLVTPHIEVLADVVSTAPAVAAISFGAADAGVFSGFKAGGTIASPTATPINAKMSMFSGLGHDGTDFVIVAGGQMSYMANELWTPTANGTDLELYLTPATTATKVNVLFATATPHPKVGINNTNPSANLHVYGDALFSGTIILAHTETDAPAGGIFTGRRSRASSGQVLAGNELLALTAEAREIGSWSNEIAGIHMYASENITITEHGSYITFETTLATTTTKSEAMRITDSGRVGIGTPAPDTKLHVAGSIKMVDGNEGLNKVLTSDASGVASWATAATSSPAGTAGAIQFNSDPSGSFAADSGQLWWSEANNRLGIGNASPGHKLEVNNQDDTVFTANFVGTNTAGSAQGVQIKAGTNASDAAFNVRNNADSLTFMRIRGDGNVGIGTATPDSTLHVVGSIHIDTGAIYGGLGNASAPSYTTFGDSDTGTFNPGANQWAISTSGAEAMRVDASGNVGINETNPTHSLHVTGSIKMVDGNEAAGYVMVSDANGVGAWTAPAASILTFDSATSTGGAASETMTVTGLLATDTILSVCGMTAGANSAAPIGFDTQALNSLKVYFTADPGAGAYVRVAVKR